MHSMTMTTAAIKSVVNAMRDINLRLLANDIV